MKVERYIGSMTTVLVDCSLHEYACSTHLNSCIIPAACTMFTVSVLVGISDSMGEDSGLFSPQAYIV